MEQKVDPKDYVWVVVDMSGAEEQFVGLANEIGEQFIPVCASRDEAEALEKRIPPAEDAKRQVEAIHREQILKEAGENGFEVFLVGRDGALLGRLGGDAN